MDKYNIVLLISASIIGIKIAKFSKSNNFFIILACNFIEIFLHIFNYLSMIPLLFIYTVKIYATKNKWKYHIIFSIITLGIFMKDYLIYIQLVVNGYILKNCILDKIVLKNKTLLTMKQDLSKNLNVLNKLKQDIKNENSNHEKYKNEIININKEINISILDSDIPIFLLDINKNFLRGNDSFYKTIEKKIINREKLNIESYLSDNFLEYDKIKYALNKVNNKESVTINIKSKDNKKYEFTTVIDMVDDKYTIICVLKDITETYYIKNKLKESEEKYKKLIDVLDEGIIIYNENEVEYVNDKALNILSIDKKDISMEGIKKNIINKYSQSFNKDLKSLYSTNANRVISKVKTKSEKTLEIISTIITLPEKEYLLSIVSDITELEEKIEEVEESEKTYKILLKNLPEGIIILDTDNMYSYRNKSSMKLMKIIGADNLEKIIKNYRKEGEYGNFKTFNVSKEKNIDVSLAMIRRKEDNKLVVIFRILDYEYKLSKIKEIYTKLERESEYKTKFMLNIADDIKLPLDKIYRANKKLLKGKDKYENNYIENYTGLVQQNCYRLKRLLSNIKEVESIENKHLSLDLEKCFLNELLENIILKSKYYTDCKDIKVSFRNRIGKVVLNLDIDKIEKILLNLLSNAIKFTQQGGKIEFRLEDRIDNICLSIKDSGIGISEENKDVIFDEFQQIDKSLSRGCEGTGIGLSIVKRLCNLHDIDIVVNSQLGKGSEFQLLIPKKLYIENFNKEDINQVKFADKEKVDIEFSDIYLDLSS